MGDFIRYLFTTKNDLTLAAVESAFKAIDDAFSIFADPATDNSGDLIYGSEIYGELEINQRGDQVFDEDIDDLGDQLPEIEGGEGKPAVEKALAATTGMIALQLTEAGHEHYKQIDAFWDWLFSTYPGLLQIDEEGYYSQDDQILVVD